MQFSFFLRAVLACLALAAAPRLHAQGAALRPGDVVDIRIANVPPEDVAQFNSPYTLDESGMVNLPYIGNMKAEGLTSSQVQVNIQQKLISDGIYTNPSVTVAPSQGQRFVVVGGAVRAPGRVPYTVDLTLMSAINSASGFSDFAGDKIRLVRGGKVQYFSKKQLYRDPSKDPRVDPGDQIEALQSMF